MSALEPVLVVDLFPLERHALLHLLAQLSEEEWQRPTICAGWTVKDLVLLLSVEYNFAVLTNKFFTHRLERGQRSQLKRHRSEIDLTRNFSKQ